MIFGFILSIFVGVICLSVGILVGVLLSKGKSSSHGMSGNDELRRSMENLMSINNPLYRYHNMMEQERQRTRDINELTKRQF